MTKEEIKAFKPIINSMKLLREFCSSKPTCYGCVFSDLGMCAFNDCPEKWFCEEAITMLEEQEAEDERTPF